MSIQNDMKMSGSSNNMLDGWMEFAHNLYKEDKLSYHTEILNPDAMTFLDDMAEYFSTEIADTTGNFIREDNHSYRVNMVPYQRKRALETERVAKGKVEEEKESKKMKDVLIGMQR